MSVRRLRPSRAQGLVMLVLAATAQAGDVPSTALSRALGIEPILADHASLLFQFPQLAASADSAALAFGSVLRQSALFGAVESGNNEYGAGALLRGASVGGFALGQRSYLPAGSYSYDLDFNVRGSVLQAGAALSRGGLRAGAAFRASRDRAENLDGVTTPSQERVEIDQNIGNYMEGAFGAGFSVRGATVDVVLEIYDLEYELGGLQLTPSDTAGAIVAGDTRSYAGGAARITVPLGEAARAVAAGQYRHGTQEWTGSLYDGAALRAFEYGQSLECWMAAVSVLFQVPQLDVAAVSASFERTRTPLADSGPYSTWMLADRESQVAWLGFSAERTLWSALALQGGFSMRWRKDVVDVWQLRYAREERERKTRTETLDEVFSLGAGYAWRGLTVATALQLPVTLLDPFLAMDVSIRF